MFHNIFMIKRRFYYQLFAIFFLVLSLQAQESSIDFQGQPKTVQIGDKVVLTWNVPGAEAVYLTNIGMVSGKGKYEVKPGNRFSTYTLLTEGAAGLRAVDVTIEVTGGKGEAFPQREEFKHTRTFEITASSLPGLLECFHTVLQDKLGFEVDERYDRRKGKTVFVTKEFREFRINERKGLSNPVFSFYSKFLHLYGINFLWVHVIYIYWTRGKKCRIVKNFNGTNY